jgi:hypothetical protein
MLLKIIFKADKSGIIFFPRSGGGHTSKSDE